MNDISISDWAQTGATIIAALSLVLALLKLWSDSRRRRIEEERATRERERVARETLDARRIEIYQRLEIESNSVFRFETEHRNVLPLFRTHLAPPRLLQSPMIEDLAGGQTPRDEAKLIARKYYEICCNLFEIAARLRQKDIFEAEVFGSWVAWYFDTVTEWGFRAVWADLRTNYTAQLRENVFDRWVAKLIEEWDRPHAAGTLATADADEPLCVDDRTLDEARTAFYKDVAKAFHCPVVEEWLRQCRDCDPIPDHPMAFR